MLFAGLPPHHRLVRLMEAAKLQRPTTKPVAFARLRRPPPKRGVRAPILTTGFVSVSLAVAPSVGDTLAGEINQRALLLRIPRFSAR
jgi:hypothetical protein